MNTLSKSKTESHAQALVEFALVLPLMILLLMGMFDLGRGVYGYNVAASAAREGARFGATKPTTPGGAINTAEITAETLRNTNGVEASALAVTVVCNPDCGSGGSMIVTVTYTFRPLTIYFASLNLVGRSTMIIE